MTMTTKLGEIRQSCLRVCRKSSSCPRNYIRWYRRHHSRRRNARHRSGGTVPPGPSPRRAGMPPIGSHCIPPPESRRRPGPPGGPTPAPPRMISGGIPPDSAPPGDCRAVPSRRPCLPRTVPSKRHDIRQAVTPGRSPRRHPPAGLKAGGTTSRSASPGQSTWQRVGQ